MHLANAGMHCKYPAVIACYAGTDHTVILSRGGQVYSWGTAGQGQLGRIGARLLERHMKVRPHCKGGLCILMFEYHAVCMQQLFISETISRFFVCATYAVCCSTDGCLACSLCFTLRQVCAAVCSNPACYRSSQHVGLIRYIQYRCT